MNPNQLKDLVERIIHGPDISDTDRMLLGPALTTKVAHELELIDPSGAQATALDTARARLVRAVIDTYHSIDAELTLHFAALEHTGQEIPYDEDWVTIDEEPSAFGVTDRTHRRLYLQQVRARDYATANGTEALINASRDRLHRLRGATTRDAYARPAHDTPSALALRQGLARLDKHYFHARVDRRTALERALVRFPAQRPVVDSIHDRVDLTTLEEAARLYLATKCDVSKERYGRYRHLQEYCQPLLEQSSEGDIDGRTLIEQSAANLKKVLRSFLYDARQHVRNDADAT